MSNIIRTSEGSLTKSLGQLAYEEDVRRKPLYHDGTPRRSWDKIAAIARESWERNPTPRAKEG